MQAASGSLQTVQIKYSERISISINLAPIPLSATLQRSEPACAADPSFIWQARTASWTLWNSNSLVTFLSKKFSLVSSFITGPTKQNPNMASAHTLKYKDGRQWHIRKMRTCSLTFCYLKNWNSQVHHMLLLLQAVHAYADIDRGLFLAEDVTIPNIGYWNISGFSPHYITTTISRY